MPEMPEVEIVVRGLREKLIGRTIIGAKSIANKDNVIIYPAKTLFLQSIKSRFILDVQRRGKYIIIVLDQGYKLIVHLRMTGKLLKLSNSDKSLPDKVEKFICVEFALDDHSTLFYVDIRRFGTLYLVKDEDLSVIKGLVNLGPEPLSPEFSVDYLEKKMAGKQTIVKSFLLDQTKIAGLGNIYVDEALAMAKIHPQTKVKQITRDKLIALHKSINKVISQGIEDGGTSFRDYRNADNEKGAHQDKLLVFQRTGEPCFNCGTSIEKIKLGGRGTHFCPRCQPLLKE